MAAVRSDYSPDQGGFNPPRQLLTVSELEQLFGPDATVELRGGRPEHVEADLEVIPPRPTSRWMAPVLLVIFAAASLLGYALLRNSAPVQAARSFGSLTSWTSAPALGPTEEIPVEPDVQLPPLVARISTPSPQAPAPEPPPSSDTLAAELAKTVPAAPAPVSEAAPSPSPVAPTVAPKVAPVASIPAKAKPRAPAQRAASPKHAAARAVDPARENEATRRLIERQLQGLDSNPEADQEAPSGGATYPPGYIEAETR